MKFRYYQLKHAVQAQFPGPLTLQTDAVERLLIAKVMDKPLSSLYFYLSIAHMTSLTKVFNKWKTDIPELTDDSWEDIVFDYTTKMISARDRFIQIKFLHRAYYTPVRLASIYPGTNTLCSRCGVSPGTFFSHGMVMPCTTSILGGSDGSPGHVWGLVP